MDIYGEMAAQADHAGVVSIGKTLLKGSDAMNERETAANLLDGNHTDKNTNGALPKAMPTRTRTTLPSSTWKTSIW